MTWTRYTICGWPRVHTVARLMRPCSPSAPQKRRKLQCQLTMLNPWCVCCSSRPQNVLHDVKPKQTNIGFIFIMWTKWKCFLYSESKLYMYTNKCMWISVDKKSVSLLLKLKIGHFYTWLASHLQRQVHKMCAASSNCNTVGFVGVVIHTCTTRWRQHPYI